MKEYFERPGGAVDALVQVLVEPEHSALLLLAVIRRIKLRTEKKHEVLSVYALQVLTIITRDECTL